VVYTQERKKERKKRSRTCLDFVSLFAMHGMTQPKLLFILLLLRRRLRDGRGAGGSCQPQPQPSHKANSLVVYIHFAPFFFFFVFLLLLQESTEILLATAKILNCFVGGIVATKRGFPRCAPPDFPLRCTLTTHRAALPAGIRHICTITFASFC
jgi:hypothetical protein